MLLGTATAVGAAFGAVVCACAAAPSAAMERMAVVASSIFIIPLETGFARTSALRTDRDAASGTSTNGTYGNASERPLTRLFLEVHKIQ